MDLFAMIRRTNDIAQILAGLDAVNINVVENGGQNLLHTAIAYKKPEVGVELINRQIDVNHRDDKGMTPLHYTAWHFSPQLAELILEHGGDPNICDCHGNNPLWYAIQFAKGHYDLVELLFDAGADVTTGNRHGKSPLDLAGQINDSRLVELLTRERMELGE